MLLLYGVSRWPGSGEHEERGRAGDVVEHSDTEDDEELTLFFKSLEFSSYTELALNW